MSPSETTCQECGKVFNRILPRQIYCSPECCRTAGRKAHQERKAETIKPKLKLNAKINLNPKINIKPEINIKAKPRAAILETPLEPGILRDSLGRKRYLHKYQFGKPDQPITKPMLQEALEKGKFVHPLAHKSYLMISALIGSRKTEALEIFKEDIHQEGSSLFVKIPAKKHGARGGEIELPLSWLGMDLVLQQWQKTRKGKKIWRFSPSTAWRIVKRVFPTKSPHHLRWTVVTELRALKDARQITIDEIKSWTGIKRDSTIEGYGLKTQAGIHKISEVMGQTAEPQGILGHLGGARARKTDKLQGDKLKPGRR